ncbi:MAG: hypothetical protein IKN62_00520 [Elusimicrobia bacterium]|nr:hypothetical protein [Elusimicrobiota bacterium]
MSIQIKDFNFETTSNINKVLLIGEENKELQKNVFPISTTNIKKLLENNKISVGYNCDESSICYEDNRAIEYIIPIMYISTQVQILLPIVINLISNYLYDLFKGRENNNVSFRLVIKEKSKMIEYEGPISGMKEITNIIKDKLK